MQKDKAERQSDAIEAQLLKELQSDYNKAMNKAFEEINTFLKRIKDIDSGKIKPPKSADTPEKIAKWRTGFTRELMRKQNVLKAITDELASVGGECPHKIQAALSSVYEANRAYTIDTITDKVNIGISFAQYDKHQLDVLLQEKQSPFSKIAYKNLGNDKIIRRRLQSELIQATMLGESQAKIIARIRNVTGQSYAQARRVAQTERTRVQSQGRADTLHEAAELGVKIVKEWSARMRNTRESHAQLDGKRVPESEPFVTIWGNELMYPGDPTAPAEEVINCFCVLIPDVEV